MDAVVKTSPNGQPPVERDPAYPTWEAERVALVLKQEQLIKQTRGDDVDVASALFDSLVSDGFDEAHAREEADKIRSGRYEARCELRRINARLSIIKQPAAHERIKTNNEVNNQTDDYKPRLLSSLERIADSLERIASGLNCGGKRQKAGAK